MLDQNQPQFLEYLIINLGSENILGLPWLWKGNPDIDWKEGQLAIPSSNKVPQTFTIKDVLEPKESNIGGTTEKILKINSKHLPLPPSTSEEFLELLTEIHEYKEEGTPLYHFNGNQKWRRFLLQAGILDHTSEELWCAAGYTYSQQLAKAAHKEKPQKSFEEMIPNAYHKHSKVFSEKELEWLPEHKPWDHAIDLKPDAPETMQTKIYPMSITK